MKVEFEITEVNKCRKMRGVEHIKVSIFEDGKPAGWLWMNERNIRQNEKEFGADCFRNTIQGFLFANKKEAVNYDKKEA